MTLLRVVVQVELAILIACFAAVLGWKFLRGAVRWVRHIESRKALQSGMPGALRLQMLAASLVISFLYLARLPKSAVSDSLPRIPEYAVALLAGSQIVFLVALAQRLLRPYSILRNEGEK